MISHDPIRPGLRGRLGLGCLLCSRLWRLPFRRLRLGNHLVLVDDPLRVPHDAVGEVIETRLGEALPKRPAAVRVAHGHLPEHMRHEDGRHGVVLCRVHSSVALKRIALSPTRLLPASVAQLASAVGRGSDLFLQR